MTALSLRPVAPSPALGWGLGFFLLCPLLISLPLGWYQAGAAAMLPKSGSLALWSLQWLISWWVTEGLFQLARRGLGDETRRPWAAMALAVTGNALLASLYAPAFFRAIAVASGADVVLPEPPVARNWLSVDYLLVLAQASAPGALLWVALRLGYDALRRAGVGWPAPAERLAPRERGATVAAPASRLLAKLAAQGVRFEAIDALTAEDHFVRVHHGGASTLIAYRFRDALDDVGVLGGVQTHRCAWARLGSIASVARQGSRRFVVLRSGLRLPLSEGHRALVEHHLRGLPIAA